MVYGGRKTIEVNLIFRRNLFLSSPGKTAVCTLCVTTDIFKLIIFPKHNVTTYICTSIYFTRLTRSLTSVDTIPAKSMYSFGSMPRN